MISVAVVRMQARRSTITKEFQYMNYRYNLKAQSFSGGIYVRIVCENNIANTIPHAA